MDRTAKSQEREKRVSKRSEGATESGYTTETGGGRLGEQTNRRQAGAIPREGPDFPSGLQWTQRPILSQSELVWKGEDLEGVRARLKMV
ncbi:hypothetical protein H9L39_02794 [Fusarium oxysporum f. sp. albedinis]|nr:hypothetical protein H9L39_02794 [Fusarium oxysporum f. sp. albedinis]